MMNIIYVEGVIQGMKKIKEKETSPNLAYKYDMQIFKQTKTLTDLTGNLEPAELIREMHRTSEF